MQKITETIVQFKVADKSSENAWSDLTNAIAEAITTAGLAYTGDGVKEYLRKYEDEYMEQYHGEDIAAIKKNGTWKYSKYLPNAYRSAKSVICRAADAGVSIGHGKSAVEKAIQGARWSHPILSIPSEISKHIAALKHLDNIGYAEEVAAQMRAAWPTKE